MLPTISIKALNAVMALTSHKNVPLLHLVTESMLCTLEEVNLCRHLPFNTSSKDGKGAKFCKVNWDGIMRYYAKTRGGWQLAPAKPHDQLVVASLVVGCTKEQLPNTRLAMLKSVQEWGPVDFNDMLLGRYQPHWLNSFISTVRLAQYDFKLWLDINPQQLADAVDSPDRNVEISELLRLLCMALPSLYSARSITELAPRFAPLIDVAKKHAAVCPADLSYWLGRCMLLLGATAEAKAHLSRIILPLQAYDADEATRIKAIIDSLPVPALSASDDID